MKFKIGDKVEIVKKIGPVAHSHDIGNKGEVKEVSTHNTFSVLVNRKFQWVSQGDLKKVETNCKNIDSKLFEL